MQVTDHRPGRQAREALPGSGNPPYPGYSQRDEFQRESVITALNAGHEHRGSLCSLSSAAAPAGYQGAPVFCGKPLSQLSLRRAAEPGRAALEKQPQQRKFQGFRRLPARLPGDNPARSPTRWVPCARSGGTGAQVAVQQMLFCYPLPAASRGRFRDHADRVAYGCANLTDSQPGAAAGSRVGMGCHG